MQTLGVQSGLFHGLEAIVDLRVSESSGTAVRARTSQGFYLQADHDAEIVGNASPCLNCSHANTWLNDSTCTLEDRH